MKIFFFLAMFFGFQALFAFTAYICDTNNNRIVILDTVTDTITGIISSPNFNRPVGIGITPDGTKGYVINVGGNNITPINLTTNTVLPNITSPLLAINTNTLTNSFVVSITPDGKTAYVPTGTNTVLVLDVATNTLLNPIIGFPQATQNIAISPNGLIAYLPLGGNLGSIVSVVNLQTNQIIANIPNINQTFAATVSGNGLRAYISNGAGQLTTISTLTNTVINTLNIGGVNGSIPTMLSPDNNTLYYQAGSSNGVLKTIDAATLTIFRSLAGSTTSKWANITPDGLKIYVVLGTSNTVSVIDTTSNAIINTLTGFNNPQAITIPNIATFSPFFNVTGAQKKNNFGFQVELFNEINWSPSQFPNTVSYQILRNGVLATTVLATSTLQFIDHNIIPGNGPVTYSIVPVNSLGLIGNAQSITLP